MNNMIDPRNCRNFRLKGLCPNRGKEILTYLDNQVISDVSISFTPEMFDKAFQFCANCAHFAPFAQVYDLGNPAN